MHVTLPLTFAQVVETRPRSASTDIKDNAFVAVYNDGDLSDLLFKEPAFAAGFLVETEEPKPAAVPISRRIPAAHFNTGTTPPPHAVRDTPTPEPAKAPVQEAKSSPPAERYERRPSFIEVTLPTEHKEREDHHPTSHQHPHHHPHPHRRESSEEEHVMDWWPESETAAQHVWVEKNQTSADEEEDVFEDAMWSETCYD